MVFIIIGILIGSTLLQIDIPFLKKQETVLEALPPANGVFLLEEEGYTEMIMNQAVPEDLAEYHSQRTKPFNSGLFATGEHQ